MDTLKQLYKMNSPSGRERGMSEFLQRYMAREVPDAVIKIDKVGNIMVTKGKAQNYPCLACHIDEVHRRDAKESFHVIDSGPVIYGWNGDEQRFSGIGADDKNGIWIVLKTLKESDSLKVVFFVREEVGCQGSSAFDLAFFEDCRFVIEPDRRGNNDLIVLASGVELCSPEFIADSHYEAFGYEQEEGILTDVLVLKERGLEISCLNLSCGYYNPHCNGEYTIKSDLLNAYKFVLHMVKSMRGVYPHTYREELGVYELEELALEREEKEREKRTPLFDSFDSDVSSNDWDSLRYDFWPYRGAR